MKKQDFNHICDCINHHLPNINTFYVDTTNLQNIGIEESIIRKLNHQEKRSVQHTVQSIITGSVKTKEQVEQRLLQNLKTFNQIVLPD